MVHEAKRRVRREAKAARAGVPADLRAAHARALAERLLALPELAGARGVLAFAAMDDEIDLAPTIAALRARGVRVAFPRVCGPRDLAVHWAEEDELAPGYCGIREPAEGAESADPAEIDVVLVPGAAFDESCRRLGLGAGFYDALLAAPLAHARHIAVAFDEQVVDEVPVEEHDALVHVLVTPTRVVRS